MGEDRGLDRLEELQRRARDQQHVEDEAGERRRRRTALTISTAAFRSVCSASMIASTATAKRVPWCDRQVGDGLLDSACAGPSRARRRAPARRAARRRPRRRPPAPPWRSGQRPRHDHQRHERRGRHAERDRRLAVRDPDRHREREQEARGGLQQHEPAVEAEALVPGEQAAREVAAGVGEHADDQDPVERARAAEQVVLDLRPQRERDDQEQQREARAGSSPARAADGPPARAPRGRRSCARAAARPAGRAPTGSRTWPTTAARCGRRRRCRASGWRARSRGT